MRFLRLDFEGVSLNNMFQFVNWLKAFATIFITNSHYGAIWPISAMAVGGHLGNCLFFMVSGFCMYNIREAFPRWYLKRFLRIYPALWIVATVDFLVGRNSAHGIMAYVHCYLFPTWYHFITSIMLLYIGFYVVRFIQKKLQIGTEWFIGALFAVFMVMYLTVYDRSYYHIDDVLENWVRFQFFASMLVGVLLREKYEKISDKLSVWNILRVMTLMAAYFIVKVVIGRRGMFPVYQCALPILQVLLVADLGLLAVKLEKRKFFDRAPGWLNRGAAFLSGITLEIYLGQLLIFWLFQDLPFPVDFVLVTPLIIAYAWIVHKCASWCSSKAIKLLKL